MIVCQCHGVPEEEIRRAVRSGAGTLREVGRACRAGTGCGSCCSLVAQVVSEERAARATPELAPELAAAS